MAPTLSAMSNQPNNEPLTSTDQSKILIFGLLLVPTLFFVGVIPVIFLIFGFWMLKKNEDFSHIETAVRNVRVYCLVVFAGCALVVLYNMVQYEQRGPEDWFRNYFLEVAAGFGVAAAIALGYFFLAKVLLLDPLRGHEKWIETNGMFSTKAKAAAPNGKQSDVSIVQGGRMSPSYSVADELIKWSKLKDDGHITAEQYNAAKDKLLNTPTT
jgi:hypothetical protein